MGRDLSTISPAILQVTAHRRLTPRPFFNVPTFKRSNVSTILNPCLPSSVSSSKFRIPQPPLLASLMRLLHPERFYGTKTAGVCTQNSHSGSPLTRSKGSRSVRSRGTHQSRLQSAHMSDCLYPLSPIPYTLSPFFSHSCALFCAFLHSPKTQLFSFQSLPHSSSKNKGRVIC